MLWPMPCPGSIQWKTKCTYGLWGWVVYKLFVSLKSRGGGVTSQGLLNWDCLLCMCLVFFSLALSSADKD